jgi:poly(hydroxyalkanoate) depolymerase family esterase
MQISSLWPRVRDYFGRIFRRKPEKPGHFVEGSKFSWRGWLSAAPWIWPSRDYLLYVPRGYGGWRRRVLVVLIHGCKQSPEDIAAGSRIAAMADKQGWLVLLPRQSDKANPWSCWNWFDKATSGGRGEAAIVAAQIRAVRRSHRVHPRRVFVAGMSAGGCLAAVMGVRHPDLFAGVFIHSGIACGGATSAMDAMHVMAHGALARYEQVAEKARLDAPPKSLPIPVLVVQGGADDVVADINAVQLVRQYLVLNGRLVASDPPSNELPPPDAETTEPLPAARTQITSEWGKPPPSIVRLVRVPQLAHAWSGGDEALPYNDSHAPDATALLAAFVAEHTA